LSKSYGDRVQRSRAALRCVMLSPRLVCHGPGALSTGSPRPFWDPWGTLRAGPPPRLPCERGYPGTSHAVTLPRRGGVRRGDDQRQPKPRGRRAADCATSSAADPWRKNSPPTVMRSPDGPFRTDPVEADARPRDRRHEETRRYYGSRSFGRHRRLACGRNAVIGEDGRADQAWP